MEDIKCPFCLEEGFDLVGLKCHLHRYCEIYGGIGDAPPLWAPRTSTTNAQLDWVETWPVGAQNFAQLEEVLVKQGGQAPTHRSITVAGRITDPTTAPDDTPKPKQKPKPKTKPKPCRCPMNAFGIAHYDHCKDRA